MEAEVDQALGHVVHGHAAAVLERAQVEDALVGHQAAGAAVEHRIVLFQPAGDVVGAEDGDLGGAGQTGAAHHLQVHPGDRQDAGAAIGRRADRAFLAFQPSMAGQEGRQVRLDADGADARTAAAVGDAEGLVQVEVGDVTAELTRGAETDHGVHVGAVDIDLAAVVMDHLADLADGLFEHPVGGRVGDHQRGQALAVLLGLGAQVVEIDVAALVAGHHHHAHVDHAGGGGVGAVGRGRDQADVALTLAAARVIGTDGQEAGVLALGAGVGLQGDGVIAGGGAEHGLQLGGELGIALGLVGRGEGMDTAEFRPGDRDHLAGGVELHGAGAQRDHGAIQRQVLVRQLAQVAHQLGLGSVAGEHRMGQEGRLTLQCCGHFHALGIAQLGDLGRGLAVGQDLQQRLDVGQGAGLVEGHAQGLGADFAQVVATGKGGLVQRGGACAEHQGQGVEGGVLGLVAQALQAGGQQAGQTLHPRGDAGQAFGTVVDRVHAGDVGQEHLGGADIAGGLLAADVLLAGLQCQAIGRVAVAVDGHADDAPGHVALVLVLGGEVGRVRAAETERYAKALGGADGHVRAQFAGRGEQGQGQQVGGHGHQGTGGLEGLDALAVVTDLAGGHRILEQRAEEAAVVLDLGFHAHHHLDAQGLGAGAQHIQGLRMAVHGGEEGAGLVFRQALAEGHGLGGGGALVQQRGIGHRHAGEVADQRLEVEQGFQATLGDLRLVGGIGGVPGRIFQQVAQDRRRGMGVVVALADQALEQAILAGDGAQLGQGIGFGQPGGQVQHTGALDALGDHLGGHGVQGFIAEQIQHGDLVELARTYVARDEFVGGAEGVVQRHGGLTP